jgi:two-component system OmpR family sensor kinase
MTSLRARLLAAMLALTALGMLLLAGITYAEQRSFHLQRIDESVAAAVRGGPLEHALDGGDRPGGDGGPGRGPQVGLPPGTYGQLRDASGTAVREVVVTYGTPTRARPALPRTIEPGRPFTVPARGGGGRYRVLARRDPRSGGMLVVAVPLTEVDETLRRLLLVEALVILGVLAVLGAVGWAIVRIGLRPLDRMAGTAGAIAGGGLSRRVAPADGRSEVGRLGLALNAMLDRLEEAFAERRASEERLRRFIADASHELRTPLTSIRGYAELFRLGAADEPEDVARSMRRIEEEAARMGVLVEDLLTLARLDRVEDAPHGPVDLGTLVRDAVDDARATAPSRPIAVEVREPATVAGDADGLRQVLANLLRNALVHTPDGTPVEVTVAPEDDHGSGDERAARGRIRLEVRDHGPGLPAGDPAALFERFWRAEAGRERGKGGAGLGLAIVAAIVAAHGGRVVAADAPDGGASFVVYLPRIEENAGG